MTRQETLARTARLSARPVHLALKGLDDADRTRQTPDLPNHVAWVLGHCALTMHRAAEHLDGRPPPETDFSTDAGDAERYDTESVCFGSTPADDAGDYPTLARGRAIFDAAIARLETAALHASDAELDATVRWGAVGDDLPLADLVLRVSIHNGIHAGQLMDLRRVLGLPSVFG